LAVDRKNLCPFHSAVRRRIHLCLKQLSLLAVFCVLPGCATKYHEPSPSENRVAFIGATAPVWIVSIDGKAVSRFGITGDKRFAVSPGHHVIELQYSGRERREVEDWYGRRRTAFVGNSSTNNAFLEFTAVAGHNYFVHDGRMDDGWKPFISESHEPVFLDLPRP
jgi:hypothetical protein